MANFMFPTEVAREINGFRDGLAALTNTQIVNDILAQRDIDCEPGFAHDVDRPAIRLFQIANGSHLQPGRRTPALVESYVHSVDMELVQSLQRSDQPGRMRCHGLTDQRQQTAQRILGGETSVLQALSQKFVKAASCFCGTLVGPVENLGSVALNGGETLLGNRQLLGGQLAEPFTHSQLLC